MIHFTVYACPGKLGSFCAFAPRPTWHSRELALFRTIWLCPGRHPPDLPCCPNLALFFRGLSNVLFTITPFPQSTCPSFRPEGNWLCLYNRRWPRGEAGGPRAREGCPTPPGIGFVLRICPSSPAPGASSTGLRPQIGFVLPGPVECTIHHNSFPGKPLPLFLLRPKLGLFGAIVPRPPPLRPSSGRVPPGMGFVLHSRLSTDHRLPTTVFGLSHVSSASKS